MDGLTTLPPSTLSPRGVTALLRLIPWSPNMVYQPLPLRPLELLSLHLMQLRRGILLGQALTMVKK
ncbi:BnaC04g49000D [Brassica napus]|uniref:(rape) hypothetical protein n=1 Tax=Brassica napus TaxID=3708 RepID=A0A078GE62_BRANA|nr:unnamed protein product [Brassica napus]CDY23372.1 BnaC04g49000D [Brassica napus]